MRPSRSGRRRDARLGAGLEWHSRRAVAPQRILDAARLDAFPVVNEARPIRAVALDVLGRAGWLVAGEGVPDGH